MTRLLSIDTLQEVDPSQDRHSRRVRSYYSARNFCPLCGAEHIGPAPLPPVAETPLAVKLGWMGMGWMMAGLLVFAWAWVVY